MDLGLGLALLILGFVGAFLSGLLGLGGALIMIPLLLYVPPLLGLQSLDMRVVAGLSMVQVVFAALSGVLAHRNNHVLNMDLIRYMGGGGLLGSLAGGIASGYASSWLLSAIFASLASLSLALMLLPKKEAKLGVAADELEFNRALAFVMALAVGVLAGMVGAGGAFILIPLMLYVLRIPLRTTIGSSLGIVFLASLAGAAGKIGTGQVVYPLAAALVLGAFPGAQLGGRLSKRVNVEVLRWLLTLLIAATALKMWSDLLAR